MENLKPHCPNFLAIVDESIEEEEKAYTESRSKGFKHNPSSATMQKADGSIVGACLRQVWFRAKEVPISNPKPISVKYVAGFGNAIHDWFIAKLQKSKKITVIPEAKGHVKVDELTNEISFRLDGLVTHRGELGCLEIKTKGGWNLQSMVKGNGPPEEELLQVISYFGTNDALMWAGLVYLARDSGYRAEYHIKRNPDKSFTIWGMMPDRDPRIIKELTFEKIVERLKLLEGYIENDVMPPRDYKVVFNKEGEVVDKRTKAGKDYKSDSRCLFCSHKDYCWSMPDALEESIKIPMNQFEKEKIKTTIVS